MKLEARSQPANQLLAAEVHAGQLAGGAAANPFLAAPLWENVPAQQPGLTAGPGAGGAQTPVAVAAGAPSESGAPDGSQGSHLVQLLTCLMDQPPGLGTSVLGEPMLFAVVAGAGLWEAVQSVAAEPVKPSHVKLDFSKRVPIARRHVGSANFALRLSCILLHRRAGVVGCCADSLLGHQ